MPAVIRVGTDCSGMEAPIQALNSILGGGVGSVAHRFSCDIDKHARATINANFPPETMYEDITARDNSKAPAVDLYVAGFPCQPFSMAGQQRGFQDKKKRGKIFFNVLDYIQSKKPRAFILENVAGLMRINKGTYFKAILQALNQLGIYNIHHSVMDTKKNGIPHSRPRVYMIGILKSHDTGSFTFPEAIACPALEKFLDHKQPSQLDGLPQKSAGTALLNVKRVLRDIAWWGEDPKNIAYAIDCDSTVARCGYMKGVVPCITCGRSKGHWVTSRGRRLNKPEMMRLQGMDPTNFKVAVSEAQLGKQLGNTMSCNVLERVLVKLLPAAGLVPAHKLEDRWASGAAVQALAATRGTTLRAAEQDEASGPAKGTKRAAPGADGAAPSGKGQRAAPEAAARTSKRVKLVMA